MVKYYDIYYTINVFVCLFVGTVPYCLVPSLTMHWPSLRWSYSMFSTRR